MGDAARLAEDFVLTRSVSFDTKQISSQLFSFKSHGLFSIGHFHLDSLEIHIPVTNQNRVNRSSVIREWVQIHFCLHRIRSRQNLKSFSPSICNYKKIEVIPFPIAKKIKKSQQFRSSSKPLGLITAPRSEPQVLNPVQAKFLICTLLV